MGLLKQPFDFNENAVERSFVVKSYYVRRCVELKTTPAVTNKKTKPGEWARVLQQMIFFKDFGNVKYIGLNFELFHWFLKIQSRINQCRLVPRWFCSWRDMSCCLKYLCNTNTYSAQKSTNSCEPAELTFVGK